MSADKLARLHTATAIATLAKIMKDGTAKDSDRIKAADSILDRGHGKPLSATITLPPSKLALQQLAAMSDDELMAVIRKPLPRLAAPAIDAEYEEVPQKPNGCLIHDVPRLGCTFCYPAQGADAPWSGRDPLLD